MTQESVNYSDAPGENGRGLTIWQMTGYTVLVAFKVCFSHSGRSPETSPKATVNHFLKS